MQETRPTYHLASSANIDFLPGLISLLESIAISTPSDAAIHYTVLSDELPQDTLSRLEQAFDAKNTSRTVSVIEMSEVDFSKFYAYLKYETKANYYRLKLPELLDVEDVIYS